MPVMSDEPILLKANSIIATFLASRISYIYLALFFSVFMLYISIQMFLNKKPKKLATTIPKKTLGITPISSFRKKKKVAYAPTAVSAPYPRSKNLTVLSISVQPKATIE